MNPYRSHNNIGIGIYVAFVGLCGCPDMMGKVGGAIYKIVGVEEWKGIYQHGTQCN
jgi:hypothetical protein